MLEHRGSNTSIGLVFLLLGEIMKLVEESMNPSGRGKGLKPVVGF